MPKDSVVALVRCQDYQPEHLADAVRQGLDLVGGAGRFASAGEKILLKPNILFGEDPVKCIGPHPQVFAAIAREFLNTGAVLSFGDSSGVGMPRFNAKRAGFLDVADELGISLADFSKARVVPFPQGNLIKQFAIAEGVLASDGLVSICKFKTHELTRITGAIKNQFGCIPGARKAEFHSALPNAAAFSRMLVDLNLLLKPRLYIMDGILAMEGNGPRNGDPIAMNVLLFSTDPVALDTTACRMIALDPELVEPLVQGEACGLGTTRNITCVGDPLESFINPDFKANRSTIPTTTDSSFLATSFLRRFSSPRPVIDPLLCTRCGQCVKICPAKPKALAWSGNERIDTPFYDYSRCIRCYCCQETCPSRAISVKIPLLGRIIRR
jgi:uncharacterized protein (DUF362 family)/NAD-dependent dihydropyrimidine dehydrogenase PreA subunit